MRKLGYNEDQIKELCNYDKDIEEVENEIKDLEEKAKNPELYLSQKNETEENEDVSKKPVKKVILDREWDKPKLSKLILIIQINLIYLYLRLTNNFLEEKMWEKHIQKLRNERNKLYAPPKFYENQKKKNKKKENDYKSVPPPSTSQ